MESMLAGTAEGSAMAMPPYRPDSLLAVEIISPGSRNVDLHLKPFEYAEAQIPHYWIVDLDPPAPSITVFHLSAPGDGYVEEPATAGQLVTTVPFDLHIDIPL